MKSPVITRVVDSQPGWTIKNKNVSLAVTKLGAQMAPVTFCLEGPRPVQPYYISPWQKEKHAGLPAVLAPLRGDFFCMPFGGNLTPWKGERHPPHGEIANGNWTLENSLAPSNESTTLRIRFNTKVRPGIVRRAFTLRDGHNAIYCSTVVEGFAGPTSFAHHAILRTLGRERSLLISTSKFQIGRTPPARLADPLACEYQWLAADASFRSLSSIPSLYKGEPPVDCSAFPTRTGFVDWFQQFERPRKTYTPSWAAAVNIEEHWLWFALKNPAVMPARLFWVENHGRHTPPWSGRNSCIGIEDGCMYFDSSIAQSLSNPVQKRDIPTAVTLKKSRPFEVRYIQGAVTVPPGFDRVAAVRFTPGAATFRSHSGREITVKVNHEFLFNSVSL